MVTWSDFDRVKPYVFARLEEELSPTLYYHNLAHTRDDVLPAAIRLLTGEGVNQTEQLLLQTAVLFHDIGHVQRYDGHEDASMQIAADTLPGFGYGPSEISQILELIAATRLSHPPANHLEALIKDADLDVLGRDDFREKNISLLRELRARNVVISDDSWRRTQLKFLKEHVYFTATARLLRGKQKQANIDTMQALLAGGTQEEG